jgi:DNA invertase Pin-like site-specific DNA recombinase
VRCDAQREACAAFIGAHPGWCWNELPYDDEGKSGESLQRPGLQQLLQDVRAGAIDRVVVHRLDRLSRRLVDCATILSELQEGRVPLVVVTSPELGTSAMQTLMANILASVAEFENEMTRQRMTDARNALRARGRRVAGRVPCGFTTDSLTKQLVVHRHEARRVRSMFRWATEGKTATEIAALANRKRWRTRTTVAKPRGGHWTPRICQRR